MSVAARSAESGAHRTSQRLPARKLQVLSSDTRRVGEKIDVCGNVAVNGGR